jgi:hypothetical protein
MAEWRTFNELIPMRLTDLINLLHGPYHAAQL